NSNLSTFSLFGLDSVSFITLKFNFISTERFSVVWRATHKYTKYFQSEKYFINFLKRNNQNTENQKYK
ncbi:hypothetical protein, partial [Riemerella anatipestifer]|uniref:hypothetical protein n=1 Tax=Riemerella anatipestifer TaxID=34085 RepID=UPI00285720F5